MSKITTANISIRMDTDLKAKAEKLFSKLGMSLSTAFNIFVRQSLREKGIPFIISCDVPNAVTKNAIKKAAESEGKNVSEYLKDLVKDDIEDRKAIKEYEENDGSHEFEPFDKSMKDIGL